MTISIDGAFISSKLILKQMNHEQGLNFGRKFLTQAEIESAGTEWTKLTSEEFEYILWRIDVKFQLFCV